MAQRLEAGERLHIVAYGTSLTEFGAWVPELRPNPRPALFRPRDRLTKRGRHGVGTRWGLEHLEERVIAERPDVVLIEFAINDAFEALDVAPRESRALLEQMIERIEAALPDCEIILMTTNPTTGGYARRDLAPYYQAVRDVAGSAASCWSTPSPPGASSSSATGSTFDAYLPDGTHPSPKGDAAITTPRIHAALGLCKNGSLSARDASGLLPDSSGLLPDAQGAAQGAFGCTGRRRRPGSEVVPFAMQPSR